MNVFATQTLFSQSNQMLHDKLSCHEVVCHEDATCKDEQLACEIEAQVDCMMADLRSIKMKLGAMQEKQRKFEQQSKMHAMRCEELSAENIKLLEQLRASSSDLEDSKSLHDKLKTSHQEQSEEMKALKIEKLVLETFCKKTYKDLVELV